MVLRFPTQATLPECERLMGVDFTVAYAFQSINGAIATLMDELLDPSLSDTTRTEIAREAQKAWLSLAAVESTAVNQFGKRRDS